MNMDIEALKKTLSYYGEFHAGLDEPGRILLYSTLALTTLCLVVLILLGGFGTALLPLLVLVGIGYYVFRKLKGLESQHNPQVQDDLLNESEPPETVR